MGPRELCKLHLAIICIFYRRMTAQFFRKELTSQPVFRFFLMFLLAVVVLVQIKFEAHPIQSTLKGTNMSPTKFWVVVSSIAYFHPKKWGRFPFQIGWEDKFFSFPPVRREFLGFSTVVSWRVILKQFLFLGPGVHH